MPNFFNTPTFEEQGKIVTILGEIDDDAALNLLSRMSSHRDKYMRIHVINAIKKSRQIKSLLILYRCLSEEDASVRNAAYLAIQEKRKDHEFVIALRQLISSKKLLSKESRIIEESLAIDFDEITNTYLRKKISS